MALLQAIQIRITDLNQIEAAIAAYADALVALNWMQDNQNEYCMDTTRLAYWGGLCWRYHGPERRVLLRRFWF